MKLKLRIALICGCSLAAFSLITILNLQQEITKAAIKDGGLDNPLVPNDLQINGHLQARRSLVDESNHSGEKTPSDKYDVNFLVESLKKELSKHDFPTSDVAIQEYVRLLNILKNSNKTDAIRTKETKFAIRKRKRKYDVKNDRKIQEVVDPEILHLRKLLGLNGTEKLYTKRKQMEPLMLYPEEDGFPLPAFRRFHNHISQYELYSEDDPSVDELLYDMTYEPIVAVEEFFSKGTQLKLIFTLANGCKVLFKPGRFPRSVETLPDHFYFSDYERHNAEIAAFHLDRILGFRRVVPVAGRVVNITYDIKRHAGKDLAKFVFISPANNVCFYGTCSQYCKSAFAVCGKPDLIEGSFALMLPSKRLMPRQLWQHPWRRSYSKFRKASWETDDEYCYDVKESPPYDGRRLLYIMDMAVLDFLMGNMDRHHYDTILDFGNDTFPLHLDQGRAFGKSRHDEMSALAPISQCCVIRWSTLRHLVLLDSSPVKLSQRMRDSMEQDSVSPILTEAHLVALDRRLKIILKTIYTCIRNAGIKGVVIDDGL